MKIVVVRDTFTENSTIGNIEQIGRIILLGVSILSGIFLILVN